MKKILCILIVAILVMCIGCASQEEMADFYEKTLDEANGIASPAMETSTPTQEDVKITRGEALELIKGLDIGDENIVDTKTNAGTAEEKMFKFSGDIYEYEVSEKYGRIKKVEVKKITENFDINTMLTEEEILPIAYEYGKKICCDFDLDNMERTTKAYKVGKGDKKDPIRTYSCTDWTTIIPDVDINNKVSVVVDQNGKFISAELSYNPDFELKKLG